MQRVLLQDLRGISFMVAYCLCMATMTAVVKYLSLSTPIFVILFFQYGIGFVLTLSWIIARHRWQAIDHGHNHLHFFRAFFGITAFALYYYSLQYIPLTEFTAITFVTPLLTVLFASWMLKEKIGLHRIIMLGIGFLGMLLVVKPGIFVLHPEASVIIIGLVCWSIVDIIIKKISMVSTPLSQTFYFLLFKIILVIPFAWYNWETPAQEQWGWLLLIGSIFLIGIMCVFFAFQNAEVSLLMPFEFSRLIFATILGVIFFQESLDVWVWLGAMLILGCGVYIIRHTTTKA